MNLVNRKIILLKRQRSQLSTRLQILSLFIAPPVVQRCPQSLIANSYSSPEIYSYNSKHALTPVVFLNTEQIVDFHIRDCLFNH